MARRCFRRVSQQRAVAFAVLSAAVFMAVLTLGDDPSYALAPPPPCTVTADFDGDFVNVTVRKCKRRVHRLTIRIRTGQGDLDAANVPVITRPGSRIIGQSRQPARYLMVFPIKPPLDSRSTFEMSFSLDPEFPIHIRADAGRRVYGIWLKAKST